jgi:hypothetical protein
MEQFPEWRFCIRPKKSNRPAKEDMMKKLKSFSAPSLLSTARESVSVSVPGWLLEELDRGCETLELTRSALICRALRQFLLKEMDSPELWEMVIKERSSDHVNE